MIRPIHKSPVLRRIRYAASKTKRFVLRRVLHADDSPHRLAMGMAVGLFIAFTPTIGIQLLLFFPMCWLLRGNSAVGFPALWITNMFTAVPVYMVQYWIGAKMLGVDPFAVNWAELDRSTHGSWWESVKTYTAFTVEHAGPLSLGSGLTALMIALIGYVTVSAVVKQYRFKKFGSYAVPTTKLRLTSTSQAA